MLFPLAIQPGVFRAGTEYQSKNKWYDTHLVRWYEGGALGPILGWVAHSTSVITGSGRAILTWRDDSNNRRAGIGTHSKLYVMNSSGALFDITPAGFTAGRASATGTTGYGQGLYGAGTYGTSRVDSSTYLDATVWDLETWGQYLVGCTADDGKLYQWILNTANPATQISGSPTSCKGMVVTPQRFIIALGAGGNNRTMKWCDQGDNTNWTAGATNQAGSADVKAGKLVCGKAVGDQTLILTDIDAHILDYIGLPYVFSDRIVGSGCGAISKKCIASAGAIAAWWSLSGFWIYDGTVRALPCTEWDYLQRTVSQSQRSKISAWHNPLNKEFWWQWPSSSSTEIDSYVVWNYGQNIWFHGSMTRQAGCESGIFVNPMMIGTDGYIYDHEYGYTYTGSSSSPYARSGPVEIGNGDSVSHVLGMVQDEKTVGDVTVSFRTRFYPNSAETVLASTTLTSTGFADLRFTARQAEIVVTGSAATNWRWGTPRLDVKQGGKR